MDETLQEIVVTGSRASDSLGPFADYAFFAVATLLIVSLFSKPLRDSLSVPVYVALPLGAMLAFLLTGECIYLINGLVYDNFDSYEALSESIGIPLPSSDDADAASDIFRGYGRIVTLVCTALFLFLWIGQNAARSRGELGDAEAATERPVIPPARGIFGRIFWYFNVRRAVLSNPKAAIALSQDPEFHPAGYAITRGWIAALPGTLIVTALSFFVASRGGIQLSAEDAANEIYSTAYGILVPAMLPFVVSLLALLAAWTLNARGADARQRGTARDVYLTYAGTWGLWPQMVLVTLLSVMTVVATESDVGDEIRYLVGDLVPGNELNFVIAVFASPLVLVLLWQLYLTLIKTPAATMTAVYPAMGTGGRFARLLLHTLVMPPANVILGLLLSVIAAAIAYGAYYALDATGLLAG